MTEIEYWVPFAPHVVGHYEPRPNLVDLGPGEEPEQRWRVTCGRCGATFQGVCTTGAVRTHFNRFATQHLHRDPLAPG